MKNTSRDHTEEGRDRDDAGGHKINPPETPVPDSSSHIPGGATEMAETGRALQPPMEGAKGPQKKKD